MTKKQNQADNAAAAAKIKNGTAGADRTEMSQEHGIHGKTIAMSVLMTNQLPIKKAINSDMLLVLIPDISHPRLSVY
jgi:hypothetical protein